MPQGKRIYAAEGFRVFMLFILIVPGAASRGAGSVLFVYFNDFYTLYSISAAKYRKVVRVCKEGVIFSYNGATKQRLNRPFVADCVQNAGRVLTGAK